MKRAKYQQNMVMVCFDTKINNSKEGRFIMSSVIRESGKKRGRAINVLPTRGEDK